MPGQAPATARDLHYRTIGSRRKGWMTEWEQWNQIFLCQRRAVKLVTHHFFFSDSASATLCKERRSISTRHAGGYCGGLLPRRMGLLCVFTAVNCDVFRSHQWLRGQVSHYLFLLIVYSALMWWSSWSVGQEVEAKLHGGEHLASVGTGQELMQLSCSRWHTLTFVMIIESPTLQDCQEMVQWCGS